MSVNYCISKALIENKDSILNESDINIIFTNEKINSGFMQRNYTDKIFFENECIELDTYKQNILLLK